MLKKILIILVAVFVVFAMLGCDNSGGGGSKSSNSNTPNKPGKPVDPDNPGEEDEVVLEVVMEIAKHWETKKITGYSANADLSGVFENFKNEIPLKKGDKVTITYAGTCDATYDIEVSFIDIGEHAKDPWWTPLCDHKDLSVKKDTAFEGKWDFTITENPNSTDEFTDTNAFHLEIGDDKAEDGTTVTLKFTQFDVVIK